MHSSVCDSSCEALTLELQDLLKLEVDTLFPVNGSYNTVHVQSKCRIVSVDREGERISFYMHANGNYKSQYDDDDELGYEARRRFDCFLTTESLPADLFPVHELQCVLTVVAADPDETGDTSVKTSYMVSSLLTLHDDNHWEDADRGLVYDKDYKYPLLCRTNQLRIVRLDSFRRKANVFQVNDKEFCGDIY